MNGLKLNQYLPLKNKVNNNSNLINILYMDHSPFLGLKGYYLRSQIKLKKVRM